jgi:hypothetical protein
LQIGSGFGDDVLPGLAAQIAQFPIEKNEVGPGKTKAIVGQHLARLG